MKKIIESALPLDRINASSAREKVRAGHPGNLLLWWNRSPIDSTAALLFAALTDDPEDPAERNRLEAVICGLADGDAAAYQEAKALLRTAETPVIADSFCGFGGITLAAQKLGLRTESSDLNAAAVQLTKAAAEIPPRFAGIEPVHPGAQIGAKPGYEALAEDIAYYGTRMLKQAEETLSSMYPKAEGEVPFAWLWVRTAECPNPACRCRMPLAGSYVLSRAKGREYWAEPEPDGKRIVFRVHQGVCPKEKESNKLTGAGARFACPACGALANDAYLRQQGRAGELGMQMMAAAVRKDGKKCFLSPDAAQEAAADVPRPEDPPVGEIAQNSRSFSPPLFGLTEYADLYTARQLRMLCCLCDMIPQIQIKAASDALAAGMSPEGGALETGGAGALAYGQAIGIYLTLVICKLANYHAAVCSWDNRTGHGRAAFSRQAIPMAWTFAEEYPFSQETGNASLMLAQVVGAVRNLPEGGTVRVTQRDAVTMDYPNSSLFCSELPWYDHVGYADLSDYFYIWMRRCLYGTEPELFERIVTSKEELCAIPEHFGNDPKLARATYEAQISVLAAHLAAAVSEEYPSLLFFLYTEADDRAFRTAERADGAVSPLEHLLNSLIRAGCQITGLWPVRTGPPGDGTESVRIAVGFRGGRARAAAVTRRGWVTALKRELPERLNGLLSAAENRRDRLIAAMGFGMAVFTRHEKIFNADGSDMELKDALFLIRQEAEACLDRIASENDGEERDYAGEL